MINQTFGSAGSACPTRGPEWPHRCSVQKHVQHGVPNDLKDVWSKNLSNAGSRMTFGMFGPKTLPTRGPERPLGCSVQKPYQLGVPNDLWDVRSKNLTNAGSQMTFGMFGPKTLPSLLSTLYLCICVFVYLCILHLIQGNVIFDILESHAFKSTCTCSLF